MIYKAAVPVTEELLQKHVEDLLFANPDRLAKISDRKLRRTRKRLPKLLAQSEEITRRRLRFAVPKWPNENEGRAESFKFRYPAYVIQEEALMWLQHELPQFEVGSGSSTKSVDGAVGSGAGAAIAGRSATGGFLGTLILGGLLDGPFEDDRVIPSAGEVPCVGELGAARDRYEALLPDLADVEERLPSARAEALATQSELASAQQDQRQTKPIPSNTSAADREAVARARRIWEEH